MGDGDEPEAAGTHSATPAAPREPVISVRMARALYAVAVVVAGILLVIDVVQPSDWNVDTTAVALVGIIVVIPLVEQIRKLKFGDVEVELADVQRQVARVDERVKDELAAVAADSPDESIVGSTETLETTTAPEADVSEPIERIVWVDDEPAGNASLVHEFSKRYDVEPARTTHEAISLVATAPARTLVISDSFRVEDGRRNYRAGEELATTLRQRFPYLPIFIFASAATVRQHTGTLVDAGADFVTSSSIELGRRLRRATAQRSEAAVRTILRQAGEVKAGQLGLDFVVGLDDGSAVGVEVRDWRRRPTREALDTVWTKLGNALEHEEVTRALLVVPKDVLTEQQRARAPAHAASVTIAGLASALRSSDAGS